MKARDLRSHQQRRAGLRRLVVVAMGWIGCAVAAQCGASPADNLLERLKDFSKRAEKGSEADRRRILTEAQTTAAALREIDDGLPPQQVADLWCYVARLQGACGAPADQRLESLDRAEAICLRHEPPHGLARLLAERTSVYYESGRIGDLEARYEKLLEKWPDHGPDAPKKAWLYREAAWACVMRMHQPVSAEHFAEQGLHLLDRLVRWPAAVAASLQGDPDLFIMQRKRERGGTWEDARGEGLLVRGLARWRRGAFLPAVEDYQESLERFKWTGYEHRVANVFMDRAEVLLQLGRFDLALEDCHAARTLYQKPIPDRGGAGTDLQGLDATDKIESHTLMLRGGDDDWQKAEELLRGLRKRQRPDLIGEWLNGDATLLLAECLLRPGRKPEGDAAEIRRELAQARRFYGTRDQQRMAETDLLEAMLLAREGKSGVALERIASAEQIFADSRFGNLPQQVRAICLRARIQLDLGHAKDALETYGMAARRLEQAVGEQGLWRLAPASVSFRELNAEALDGALRAFHACGRDNRQALEDLYHIVQLFHGYGAACELVGGGFTLDALIPAERRPQYDKLQEALAKAIGQLDQWRAMAPNNPEESACFGRKVNACAERVAKAEEELGLFAKSLPDTSEHRAPAPRGVDDVTQCIPDGATLLEFVADRQSMLVFVLRKGSLPEIHEVASIRALHDALHGFDLSGASQAECEASLAKLGSLLCDNADNAWFAAALPADPGAPLLLSPEGDLCRVSFAALPYRGKRLIEYAAIAYVPSGTGLCELLQRPSTVVPDGRHLLAVANPRYAAAGAAEAAGLRSVLDATELGQLPATAKEAIAIAKLFATPKEIEGLAPVEDSAAAIDGELVGERFRLLLGNRASERRLTSELLHQVSVLHFACHGHADAADPAFSYLALSDNGFLRVPDLARLHGDYELMTLSACDTAKGSTIGHDGLAGLARAGLAAGARHVLATLWPVQDQSTSDFVVDVYRRWLRDHESLANALRSAQRAAIVAGKDSRTWAAFVLWGADR